MIIPLQPNNGEPTISKTDKQSSDAAEVLGRGKANEAVWLPKDMVLY